MTSTAISMDGEPEIGLHQLPHRQSARVIGLKPAGDTEEREVLLRLLEIGFLPGEPVQVMAQGFPGSDPLAVRVGNSTFALRRHEAALIRVNPLAAGGRVS